MLRTLVLTLALATLAAIPRASLGDEMVRPTSLVNLIARPSDFDGKRVRLIGVFEHGEEVSAVFLTRDDASHYVIPNGIWIDFAGSEVELARLTRAEGQYVLVDGTFDSTQRGHLGAFNGAIFNVTRFEIWKLIGAGERKTERK